MNKVAKATIGLMVVTIISKVLGFGRELVLASSYGTSLYSDAYIIALNIPTIIFEAIGVSIATTFIPMYYQSHKSGGEKLSLKFTNNIINIVGILTLIISILGFIFAEYLVKIFAIGFEGEALSTTVDFTRILIFGIIFIALSNIIKSYLNANNNFTVSGLMMGLPFNIIVIISIILSTKINPYILAYGTLLAISSKFLCQIPFAYRKGYKYDKYINLKDENIKKSIWLLGPVFLGVAVNQVNAMVDRTVASTLAEGSISALNYSNRLNQFVMGLFIVSISSVIYPILSKLSSENNKQEFADSVYKSINSIILLVVPISIGAIALANPIVKLLFERGAFDEKATQMTAIALIFYSIGMIAFGLRDILGKVFYSLQDTKTPMTNGAIAMGLNIILNLILIKPMGHAGLAFATSISSIVCIFLLFASLKKKVGYFGQEKIIKTTIKSLISALIMGIVIYFAHKYISGLLEYGFITDVIALLASIGIGLSLYGALVMLLKVEEANMMMYIINKKLNKS